MFLSGIHNINERNVYIYIHESCLSWTTPICVGVETMNQSNKAAAEYASNRYYDNCDWVKHSPRSNKSTIGGFVSSLTRIETLRIATM
jgi:hypothetical protein